MAGFLPATKPSALNYGPLVSDRRPVKDPLRESSATNFNDVRADLAFVANTAPTFVCRIANAGTASVAWASAVGATLNRTGTGVVIVTVPAGWTINTATVSPLNTVLSDAVVDLTSSTTVTVRTFNSAGAATDMAFHLEVW